jgi:tripartite-type tricarboxylate transporter receptor subunit TctC
MGFMKAALTTACAAWGMLAAANSATAADEPFYKGKTITFICASAPGGGYDTYSRLIATHIVHHLDGNPSIVVQNMPGAGSIRASNQLYNVVKKDGTFIGMIDQAIYLNQILGTPELKADATKFTWIGRILSNSAVLFASSSAPVKKAQDLFTTEMIVAASGTASRLNWQVLNNVVGTKFRIISGYKGTSDSRLAMQRGEVHGLSMPWPVLKNEGAEMLKNKEINLILQTGIDKNPDLETLPRMVDLARNDDERKLLELFASPSTIGRSVVAPPDLPKERTAELRKAFMEAINDKAMLSDVARAKLDLDPLPGEQLQASIGGTDIPPALVKRARAAAGMKN